MSKWAMPAIVVVGLMAGATGRAGAAFVSLSPSDGVVTTYLNYSGTPTFQPGAGNLQVADVLASSSGPRDTFRATSLVKFDLGSIPANAQVTSAVLTFNVYNILAPQDSPQSFLSLTSGGSPTTTITPTSPTGPVASPATASLALPGYRYGDPILVSPSSSVDETATVRAILVTSSALAVNFSVGGPSVWFGIGSPTLTITFEPAAVPEPSSLAMCVAGLAGMGLWSRRRRPAA